MVRVRNRRHVPVLGVAVAAVAVGMLAGCGTSSSSGTTSTSYKIGVVLDRNDTDFWTTYLKYQQQYEQQDGVTILGPDVAKVEAPNTEPAQQIADIKTLISQGAQALIVNPNDSAAIVPGLDYAKSKKVPVIAVDNAPTGEAGSVYVTVRADNVAFGQNACSYIAQNSSSPGTIAIIEGDLTSQNAIDRTTGCKNVIPSKFSGFSVKEYPAKWDTQTGVSMATTAATSVSDIRGIYFEWSASEDGTIQKLQDAGKFVAPGAAGHIILIGVDGTAHEC